MMTIRNHVHSLFLPYEIIVSKCWNHIHIKRQEMFAFIAYKESLVSSDRSPVRKFELLAQFHSRIIERIISMTY